MHADIKSADWIHANLERRVLVHCQAGVSRSAAICIAYLMKHVGMHLTDAYAVVKAARFIIDPNEGFMRQLKEYQTKLNGGVY